MKQKIVAIGIIFMLITFNTVILFTTQVKANENQPQWPDTWTKFDTDPLEDQGKTYRDVHYANYSLDDNYLYFRLECYGYPNFTTNNNARYKWFIDIDNPHNMGQTGGYVYEQEYLLFVEDSLPTPNGDGIGDIFLLEDLNNDGLITKSDYPNYINNPGPILNNSITDYRIDDKCIDVYIRQSNISTPQYAYFTWATDQGDPNFNSAPKLDRSDNYWNLNLSKADLSIEKNDNQDPVEPGDSLIYTLNVTNHGPHNAENVNVTDMLPEEVSFINTVPTPTGNNGSNYWWTYSSLDVGEFEIITINVTVNDDVEGNITNIAQVYNDTYDPIPGNNLKSEKTKISQLFNLNIAIEGNGSVIKDPDQTKYEPGTIVELTAVSNLGWNFSNWSGDISGNNNTESIIMNDNKSVTAHFTLDTYVLKVNTIGNGTVSLEPDQDLYTYGTIVELTAIPDTGWSFSHWTGDLSGNNNPEHIIMDNDKDVIAYFTINEYTLTINIDGNGTVIKNPDQELYEYGTTVELTAVPDTGWSFSHWSGDLTGDDNPEYITIDGNKEVNAHFTINEYTLTIDIGGDGTVIKNPDQELYEYGTTVELTAIPDTGWSFSHWTEDLTGDNNPEYILIDNDKTVTAHFTINDYTLTIIIDGNGLVINNPDQELYEYGTTVELTAIPDTGWSFSHWTEDLTGDNNPEYILIDNDKTVTAHFTPQLIPDLSCKGSLSWTCKPDTTVTGNFTVRNIGNPESLLDWEIIEWPEWGEWNFIPFGGDDLTPEDGPVNVVVTLGAPKNINLGAKNTEYTGEVKIVNKDDSSDNCTIPVYLKTPRSKMSYKQIFLQLINKIIDKFPILEKIISRLQIFGWLLNLR